MVFNPVDTGVFTTTSFVVDGCDTTFVDSVVHQKLGVQIVYDINNPGTATVLIDGLLKHFPYMKSYWYGENVNIEAQWQPLWLFNQC